MADVTFSAYVNDVQDQGDNGKLYRCRISAKNPTTATVSGDLSIITDNADVLAGVVPGDEIVIDMGVVAS